MSNVNTGGATGWCLEVHDLAVSKLVAGRERDFAFIEILIRHRLANGDTLRQRLERLPVDRAQLDVLRRRLAGVIARQE